MPVNYRIGQLHDCIYNDKRHLEELIKWKDVKSMLKFISGNDSSFKEADVTSYARFVDRL